MEGLGDNEGERGTRRGGGGRRDGKQRGGRMADPFHAFREELSMNVQRQQVRFERWQASFERGGDSKKIKKEHSAFQKDLNALLSSVGDLEMVLKRIQSKRSEYAHISDSELMKRKMSIKELKHDINAIRSALMDKNVQARIDAQEARDFSRRKDKRKTKGQHVELSQREDDNSSSYAQDARQRQDVMRREQDDHLEDLGMSVGRLGEMATSINVEIEEQNKMLDVFDEDLEKAQGRMETVLTKMDKMLKTKNRCQTCTILWLVVIVIVLFILVAYT